MATRNIYVSISKSLQGKESVLKRLLIFVWLGGFVLIMVIPEMTDKSEKIFNISINIWFTACTVFGVLNMAVSEFNPDRDPVDITGRESWTVILMNIALIMAISFWFIV